MKKRRTGLYPSEQTFGDILYGGRWGGDINEVVGWAKLIQESLEKFLNSLVENIEKKERTVVKLQGGLELIPEHNLQLYPFTKDDSETAIYEFARALEGVPITAIKQCPECQHYYIHLSKRKKNYCTPTCTWRARARVVREEAIKTDPEGYRKEQREKMRKYYKAKREKGAASGIKIGKQGKRKKD